MTGKERVSRILKHQPVDRIGVYENFWNDTVTDYIASGNIKPGVDFDDHFGFDMSIVLPFNMTADLDYEPEIISETDETVIVRDGNGAVLRHHKLHDTTPEHVDFTVKTREDWEKIKPLLLNPDPRRINFDLYRYIKRTSENAGRFLAVAMLSVFECMHPVCGHENLLVGMLLDPDWILDMTQTYTELLIGLQDILFEAEGPPDGVWYYEDMGFKGKPFLSPELYKELLFPSHKRAFDYAHSLGLPVIVHSCGFIEPLLPGLIEAGMDCLQAIEVKAGMDLMRIYENYGDQIALMGGIDARTLCSNDKAAIEAELMQKLPAVKQKFGYIAHSDHSIPNTVTYETFRFYLQKVLELGTY